MGDEAQEEGGAIERHEVSRVIPADAAVIFALVSSPAGHVAIVAASTVR